LVHRSFGDDLLAIDGCISAIAGTSIAMDGGSCASQLAIGISVSKWDGDRASEDDEEMKRRKTIT
jgi:hypothetical protein